MQRLNRQVQNRNLLSTAELNTDNVYKTIALFITFQLHATFVSYNICPTFSVKVILTTVKTT